LSVPLHLNRSIQRRFSGLVLSGFSKAVNFEFHIADELGRLAAGKCYPILPELERIEGLNILCLSREDEEKFLCQKVDHSIIEVEILSRGEHFSKKST